MTPKPQENINRKIDIPLSSCLRLSPQRDVVDEDRPIFNNEKTF